jgi:hypothetical protein
VLAGYDVEHAGLEQYGWQAHEWFAYDDFLAGGMGEQQHRERLWSSPHCLAKVINPQLDMLSLFAADTMED